MQRDAATYEEAGLTSVEYAPLVLTRFLSESTSYDIFAVDFSQDRRFSHIYGMKKTWTLRDNALAGLRTALRPENYRSYLEGVKLRDQRD